MWYWLLLWTFWMPPSRPRRSQVIDYRVNVKARRRWGRQEDRP